MLLNYPLEKILNKSDRSIISSAVARLESLKSEIESVADDLRTVAESEREKFDNMPAGLQESEQGQAIENAADYLDETVSALEEFNVGDALSNLDQLS